jgi:hypothetical protein
VDVATERLDRGAQDERDEQQEAGSEHHRERDQAGAKKALDHPSRPGSHAPDVVQPVLELAEGAGRADDEGQQAQNRGQEPGARPPGLEDRRLHELGALLSDQPLDLPHDLAPSRLGPEQEARDRDRHDQHGGEREDRVIGESGGQPGNVVLVPLEDRLLDELPEEPGCRNEHLRRCAWVGGHGSALNFPTSPESNLHDGSAGGHRGFVTLA